MSTITQLIDQLNASNPSSQWKVFGNGVPVEETAPIQVAGDLTAENPADRVAHTVNRGTGRYLVTIQNAAGQQSQLPLKPDPVTDGTGGRLADPGQADRRQRLGPVEGHH